MIPRLWYDQPRHGWRARCGNSTYWGPFRGALRYAWRSSLLARHGQKAEET